MNPAKIPKLVQKAMQLHQKQKYADASKLYKSVLKFEPHNVDALHFYGLLHYHQGNPKQAVVMILAAIALNPEYADAYLNLGNIYLSVADFDNAQKCYEKALELSPNNIGLGTNLGILYRYRGDLNKSEAFLEAVVQQVPTLDAGYINLANTQMVLGKGDEALANFRQAILINPADGELYSKAIRASKFLKRNDKALEFLELWAEVDKDSPGLEHLRSALSGENAPMRASDAYIKATFDAYADSFESSLARLGYSGPELLGSTLRKTYPQTQKTLKILDAGCGTGLAHEYLKPYAKRLIGMDLSERMLEKARGKRSYDQLICSSLDIGIAKYDSYFDLIVSMDTMVYFGDLSETFDVTHKALVHNGYFIFTVEMLESAGTYELQHHGRYEHSRHYLESELTKNRLKLIEMRACVVRKEFGENVRSLLVVALKHL